MFRHSLMCVFLLSAVSGRCIANDPPDGWTTHSAREELRPEFSYDAEAGPNQKGALVIRHPNREGLDGAWTRVLDVAGGQWVEVRVWRRTQAVDDVRQCALVRIRWTDDAGRDVPYDGRVVDYYRSPGSTSMARPEWPAEIIDTRGAWSLISGKYQVPSKATKAELRLYLKWAPGGTLWWSEPEIRQIDPPEGRTVRLATVHFQPRGGKTPADNCRMFAPLIEKAAEQSADLVLLPETLTYYGLGKDYAECAESIPGPSTEYFGSLAKQHDLYIVAGLLERDRHLVYNVAVLIGPEGTVAGKYRKVCLPRGESEGGIAPGKDYPVFDTRFGKVGMMVCYDGFFPEVARELTKNGAEVIAWPVWGCNPLLAKARATENHVYLISSTYTAYGQNWIVSAVYDHTGEEIAVAKQWGDVVVAEVNLEKPTHWSGLGDFKAEMHHRRP